MLACDSRNDAADRGNENNLTYITIVCEAANLECAIRGSRLTTACRWLRNRRRAVGGRWNTLSTRDGHRSGRGRLRCLVVAELYIPGSRDFVVVTVRSGYSNRTIATMVCRVTIQGVSVSNSGDSR